MFQKFYYLNILLAVLLILIVLGLQQFFMRYFRQNHEKIRLRIAIRTEQQRAALQQFFPNHSRLDQATSIELTTGWPEFFRLQEAGLNPEIIIEMEQQELIAPQWPTLAAIDSIMQLRKTQDTLCCQVLKIGESAGFQLPLYCVRITDFLSPELGKRSVLFTAGHHGNEPLGVAICLHLIDSLCKGYARHDLVREWLKKVDIFVVPLVNPDGYRLVREERKGLVWRKNLRDNDGDGRFSPRIDGVDLNRNYGPGGEQVPGSHFYAGPVPFSEPETQGIRDLAQRQRFLAHLDFHSAGEVVLYPISHQREGSQADPMGQLANALAQQIKKRNGFGHYRVAPLDQTVGQCSIWMHRKLGVKSFIIEAGDSYFPAGDEIDELVKANASAAFWLLEQVATGRLDDK